MTLPLSSKCGSFSVSEVTYRQVYWLRNYAFGFALRQDWVPGLG